MLTKQHKILIGLCLGIVCIICFILLATKDNASKETTSPPVTFKQNETVQAPQQSKQKDTAENGPVLVDVKGAVKNPGVYEMPHNARVVDAIKKAGNFTDQAAKDTVNLAQRVQDEMVIIIAKEGEEPVGIISQADGSTTTGSETEVVDINSADQTELETLPGIGPSKAEAIIQYREENGSFATPEALMEVTGIGEKSFESLKDAITAH